MGSIWPPVVKRLTEGDVAVKKLKCFELLADSNDEPLVATIDFIFKAASQCHHLPEAVWLKNLGLEVSPCVLDFLSKTVNSWGDVAETILRDVDCDDDFVGNCPAMPSGFFLFGENGSPPKRLSVLDEQAICDGQHFSDIYVLIEMLSIPCLAIEASQTFESVVARGAFVAQLVAMVLERRLAHALDCNARYVAESFRHGDAVIEGEASEQFSVQHDDFTSLLGLAETLALSNDLRVRGFVKMLYTILFKWYIDESYRVRLLKRLVDRATSTTENSREVDLDFDILVTLVSEEQEIVRPVLSMMLEVAELANVDRASLRHQLCASEDAIIRMREETKVGISNMAKEKAALSQKLSESEATNNRLKVDMDRFAREKKELSEQLHEVESQLEWLRSERDDEIVNLTAEKKALKDRLHDAEAQLSHLKIYIEFGVLKHKIVLV